MNDGTAKKAACQELTYSDIHASINQLLLCWMMIMHDGTVSSAVFPCFIYHAGAHNPETQVLFLNTQGPTRTQILEVLGAETGNEAAGYTFAGWDRKLSVFAHWEEKELEVLVSLSATGEGLRVQRRV